MASYGLVARDRDGNADEDGARFIMNDLRTGSRTKRGERELKIGKALGGSPREADFKHQILDEFSSEPKIEGIIR